MRGYYFPNVYIANVDFYFDVLFPFNLFFKREKDCNVDLKAAFQNKASDISIFSIRKT